MSKRGLMKKAEISSKTYFIWLVIIATIAVGFYLSFSALQDKIWVQELQKGIFGDILDKPYIPGPYSQMTWAELFTDKSVTEGRYDSIMFQLVKTFDIKEISDIFFYKLIISPLGLAKTEAGGIGYRMAWRYFGYFIRFFITGYLAGFIFGICLYWMYKARILPRTINDFVLIKGDTGNKNWWSFSKFIALPTAIVYAILMVVPGLNIFIELITFATFISILPQPLETIVRAFSLGLLLSVLVFVPGIIKKYVDAKKEQKEMDTIKNIASGAATMAAVGRMARRQL